MSRTTEHRDVVVVGAGQAGLAMGYQLARQNRSFTILDAAPQLAAAWRGRWESLRLFTPVRYSSLPGHAFPGAADAYPRRDDVVAYLTDYARRFDLPVELDSPVRAVRADAGRYRVELDGRAYSADQVVIATGPFQVPRVPEIAARLHPSVASLHSGEYRSPDALPPGPVVVVGGGNSGFQIAAELAGDREVHLAIGSRQAPLPQRLLGRDLFRWLEATRLMRTTAESRLGRRVKDRETLVGSGPRTLRRRYGVQLHGRAVDATGLQVRFEDGAGVTASAVVWATGYRLDHSFVEAPVFDAQGLVVHRRGVTASPGLYFLGLPWMHTRGSALLGWVGDDAAYLAERIANHRSPAGGTSGTPLPLQPAVSDRA